MDFLLFSPSSDFWVDYLKGMLKPVAATAVVLLAIMLSFLQRLGLEEMAYSIARAFLQLSVIGFVLEFIFTQNHAGWIVLAYLFMVFYCWLYSRSTCQTHTSCEVHCGSFNFNWNCSDHVLAHCPQCLPIHSSIHHSCSGHDDWQCDDCDRSHHEETSRRSQNPEELGGDSACSRCHATAGNTTAGEEISGYCPFPSPGQCEDSGLNNSTWCNDWTYNGGCLPSGSNPTPDRCHEHADWGINSQQYYVNLLVLASLLHQGIPVGKQGLHCRIAREKSYLQLAVDGRCNLVDGNELFFWIMVNLLGVLH